MQISGILAARTRAVTKSARLPIVRYGAPPHLLTSDTSVMARRGHIWLWVEGREGRPMTILRGIASSEFCVRNLANQRRESRRLGPLR